MSKFKRKNEVTRELADEQVEMLNEFYDVDMDFVVPAIQPVLQQHLLGITKAIVRGRLSIDEVEGGIKLTQFLKDGQQIVYAPLDASITDAADRFKDPESRVRALMAAASKGHLTVAEIKDLCMEDQAVVDDLGNYFLFL